MPVPVSPVPWQGSLIWLAVLAAVSFLVTWVSADKLRMRRTPYIGVLTLVTAAVAGGYIAWLDVNVTALLTTHWAWGLLAAPLCGAFMIWGMTRLPVTQRLTGRRLGIALLWEAVIYGTTEGVLLSMLPVLMAWQMIHSLGWSGTGGDIARWTLPIAASIVIAIVHHLGYWEYRNRMLVPISAGCGLLAVGYLVTASPIAPALGHILGHATGLIHGTEMPPHSHTAQGVPLEHGAPLPSSTPGA
jgi:hypothetical protein